METGRREKAFIDYAPPMNPIGAIVPPTSPVAARLQVALLWVKAVSIVGALIAAIFVLGNAWPLYRDLPAEHRALKAGLDSTRSDIRDMKTTLAQWVCMQTAKETRTPWQDCFITKGAIAVFPPRAP